MERFTKQVIHDEAQYLQDDMRRAGMLGDGVRLVAKLSPSQDRAVVRRDDDGGAESRIMGLEFPPATSLREFWNSIHAYRMGIAEMRYAQQERDRAQTLPNDGDAAAYRRGNFERLDYPSRAYRVQVRDDDGAATHWLTVSPAEYAAIHLELTGARAGE